MYLSTGTSNHNKEEITARQQKMAGVVLHGECFSQLRAAFTATFDIIESILQEVPEEKQKYSYASEMITKLEEMDKTMWKNIRSGYLSDPYYGYANGNFTDNEMADPSKLFLDLAKQLDIVQNEIYHKIKEYYGDCKEYKMQINKIEAQSRNTALQLKTAEFRCESAKEDVSKLKETVAELQKELSEKRETIHRLTKDSTVQIWKKEKERLLAESEDRMELMEKSMKKIQEDNERMRRMMEKKLTVVDEQNKMLKMKQEISASRGHSDYDSNKIKNENYLLQKDLTVLEKELQREQILFAGILNGALQDLNILSQKYRTHSLAEMLDRDVTKIVNRISSLYEQAIEGKLWSEGRGIPEHYKTDKEVKITRTKKLSAFGRINSRSPPASPSHLAIEKPRFTNGNDVLLPPIEANPIIVDPATGRINSTMAMKHFPAVSQDSIKEHWEQFVKFDSDGNEQLDFPEVLRAMQTTIGFQFSPTQIEQCFVEVDVNKSKTIDFFEYLTIRQLLIDRKGLSEIFQSGMAKTKSSVISKTCVIQ